MPRFHWYTSAGLLFLKSAVRTSSPSGFCGVKLLRSALVGPIWIGVPMVIGGATVVVALIDGVITVGALGGFDPNSVVCWLGERGPKNTPAPPRMVSFGPALYAKPNRGAKFRSWPSTMARVYRG